MVLPPDIGLSSQICPELPLVELFERVAPLTSLVEIDSFGMHTVLSPRNRRDAIASGLRLTVHGPYGFDIQPGSRDEAVRRQAMAMHRRHLEAAAEIGALLYVAHPDYIEPPGPRDQAAVDALQRTIADLADLQDELGVPIAMENMPRAISSSASSALCSTAATRPSAVRSMPFSPTRGRASSTCTCTATSGPPSRATRTGPSVRAWSRRLPYWPWLAPPAPR